MLTWITTKISRPYAGLKRKLTFIPIRTYYHSESIHLQFLANRVKVSVSHDIIENLWIAVAKVNRF